MIRNLKKSPGRLERPLRVNWTGSGYTKVIVTWTGGGSSGYILSGTSFYNASGLASNSPYTFTVTPYNSINVPGTSTSQSTTTIASTPTITEYPTSAMTSNTSGGYIASAVGYGASPYLTFNKGNGFTQIFAWSQYSGTGAYSAVQNTAYYVGGTLTSVLGDFTQLKLPISINLKSYNMSSLASYPSRSPRSFFVLGSSNGTTWEKLDGQTGIVWTGGDTKSWTVPDGFYSTKYYNYFRVIDYEHNTGDNGNSILTEIRFFGLPQS